MDKDKLEEFMKEKCGANKKQANKCFEAFEKWSDKYLYSYFLQGNRKISKSTHSEDGSTFTSESIGYNSMRESPSDDDTQSEIYNTFASESIRNKSVRDLPGVNDMVARVLIENNKSEAYKVLGQFLLSVEEKREPNFIVFMTANGATKEEANVCYNCLREWCKKRF